MIPRLGRIALLTVLIAGLAAGIARPAAAAAPLSSVRTATSIDFPTGLTFTMKGRASQDVERVELLYTIAEQETLNLRTVSGALPKGRLDLSDTIDMATSIIPVGVDLTYRWRVTFADGSSTETDPEGVTWKDTRFEWTEIGTDQVTVYTYAGNEAFAKLILDTAQSTIDRLQGEFGVDRVRPIRLWVYNSKKDYDGSQAANSQEWDVGIAFPAYQVIMSVLPEGNKREVGRVVPHEISHQVLYQATRNPFNSPPTWLDEGLAVTAQSNGNEDFPAQVQNAAESGRLFSVRALTSEFPYDPADASLAYAESYSIVQFILARWGNEGMSRIIEGYRQGLSHDEVLRQAIGVDMTELDRLWKESLDYPGDSGVAGAAGSHEAPSAWDRLAGSATSLLLVLAAFTSLAAMLRQRSRARRAEGMLELHHNPV